MTWFFGITIGPIYGTMSLARDTGGLWAASYLFSYISHCLVQRLREFPRVSVFSPNPEANRINKRVGAFSDRIYFAYDGDPEADGFFEMLERVKNEAVEEIVDDIWNSLRSKTHSDQLLKEEVRGFLRQYLQVYYVAIDDSCLYGEPVLKVLNKLLDAAELRPPYVFKNESPHLMARFLNNETVKKSRMFAGAFGVGKFVFPSLTDIAKTETTRRKEKDGKSILEVVVQKLYAGQSPNSDFCTITNTNTKDPKPRMPKFANYYALVQADGDGIGGHITSLADIGEISNTSRTLLEYADSAVGIMTQYGAFPVYAGGDDLMFFAPLMGWCDGGHPVLILNMLRTLDEEFKKRLGDRFSLSFGLAVAYHKYPLYEALEIAKAQLDKAKRYKTKNALGISLTVHSGQSAQLLLTMNNTLLLDLIETLCNPLTEENVDFLRSVERKLRQRRAVLLQILASNSREERSSRLSWWFSQEFEGHGATLKLVQDILGKNLDEFSSPHEALETTEAVLSFARFMGEWEEATQDA
ncbi:Cas10/Cmr2 second palm domain-containing protein [Syntrophothermus lipocalidus]|uniref:GGDEF domain-containing protein n=1 Tax=Syntrophothermus lipocalidus (strain DSM 12680 / TGB-C1) TaxID=643648 RepID=D7CN34_SYNLT|nr:type III-B CRISPR-associated protein Cas10/Cmr2 [Syntrophothermus lipocalidus]ADI02119.1 hypothetical protein Slip_1356 [Syntrophothermus lipocalidus DSM 12680]